MFRVLGSGRNEFFLCVQTITRRSDESDSGDDSYRYHHFIALTFSTEIVLFFSSHLLANRRIPTSSGTTVILNFFPVGLL